MQNQNALYIQRGLDGTPELLLDPNKFSADGTSRLLAMAVSKDGQYCAYGVSTGGSDWQEGHVLEVATRKVLPDDLKWLKFTSFSWAGKGFFYSRYDAPEAGRALTVKNDHQRIDFHHLGTPQADD